MDSVITGLREEVSLRHTDFISFGCVHAQWGTSGPHTTSVSLLFFYLNGHTGCDYHNAFLLSKMSTCV